jgi:hypothetical protein
VISAGYEDSQKVKRRAFMAVPLVALVALWPEKYVAMNERMKE